MNSDNVKSTEIKSFSSIFLKLTIWPFFYLAGILIGYLLPLLFDGYQFTSDFIFRTPVLSLILLVLIHIGIRVQISIRGEDMIWNSYYPN